MRHFYSPPYPVLPYLLAGASWWRNTLTWWGGLQGTHPLPPSWAGANQGAHHQGPPVRAGLCCAG